MIPDDLPPDHDVEKIDDDIELEEIPTVFKCDNCNKYRPIEECNIELAQISYLTRESAREFVCYRHNVQICDKCESEMGITKEGSPPKQE